MPDTYSRLFEAADPPETVAEVFLESLTEWLGAQVPGLPDFTGLETWVVGASESVVSWQPYAETDHKLWDASWKYTAPGRPATDSVVGLLRGEPRCCELCCEFLASATGKTLRGVEHDLADRIGVGMLV